MKQRMYYRKADIQRQQKALEEIARQLSCLNATSVLFQEALQQNSNLAVEWLWVATQVTDDLERNYCLHKALYISPENQAARRQLGSHQSVQKRMAQNHEIRQGKSGSSILNRA